MADQSSLFPDGAVFTVAYDWQSGEKASLGRLDRPENEQSFDLAVVEFNDDGTFMDKRQKPATLDCITAARRSNRNGAIVVVYIHGWHNSASWDPSNGKGDLNFAGFRKVVMTLALRESERSGPYGTAGRRVVGVFLAWRGDPAWWPERLRKPWLTLFTFCGRYRTAKRIGKGTAMKTTIGEIVDRTKDPLPDVNQAASPLVLLGHSMGALMLESAFLALLSDRDAPLIKPPQPDPQSRVEVKRAGKPVSFPDVLIGLNSAGDSRITKDIIRQLKWQQLSKTARDEPISYSPPLFVSATSKADKATRVLWRVPFNVFRKTVGNDKALFTHTFDTLQSNVDCPRKEGVPDFDQDWSCLRPPYPPGTPSPAISIDLPERSRSDPAGATHTRYQLMPNTAYGQTSLVWVFRVPARISVGHTDIFNARCSLLILALIQISGAVMSLAKDWKDNFEPIP